MDNKVRFLLCVLAVGTGCVKTKPNLDGHWASKEFFEGKPFFTVNFKSLFIGIDLEIAPPEINNSDEFIFHDAKNFININIGSPVLDLAKEFPDSTFIQVNDIYLPGKDLPSFIKRAKDGFPEHMRDDVIIRVTADKRVSDVFLNKIIVNSEGLRVWRTYFDKKKNRLGYKQLSG